MPYDYVLSPIVRICLFHSVNFQTLIQGLFHSFYGGVHGFVQKEIHQWYSIRNAG